MLRLSFTEKINILSHQFLSSNSLSVFHCSTVLNLILLFTIIFMVTTPLNLFTACFCSPHDFIAQDFLLILTLILPT